MQEGSKGKPAALVARVPAVLVAAIYVGLLWLLPGQLVEVNRLVLGSPVQLGFVILSIQLFAVGQLALIGTRDRLHRLFDAALVALPGVAVALTFLRSDLGLSVTAAAVALAFVHLLVGMLVLPLIQVHRSRLAAVTFIGAALVFVAFAITVSVDPVGGPRLVGALGVLVCGLGVISCALTAIVWRRWTTIAATLVFVGSLAFDGPVYDVRRLPPPTPPVSREGLEQAFSAWLDGRPVDDINAYRQSRRPFPVLIASAAGGGIYAAAHAYGVMKGLAQYCPSFPNHLLAAFGVSGGSYGLAIYGSELSRQERVLTEQPCGGASEVRNENLAADHLSPALAALFFSEIPNAVLPSAPFPTDAAIALERSFEEFGPTGHSDSFLASDFATAWSPSGQVPMLDFLTSEAGRGDRFVMGMYEPLLFDTLADWFGRYTLAQVGSVRVGTAAAMSARFPWLTPVAHLTLDPTPAAVLNDDGTTTQLPQVIDNRMLADGGYFDNSGTETATDMVKALDVLADLTDACRAGTAYCPKWMPRGADGQVCRLVVHLAPDDDTEWSGCDRHIYIGMIYMGEMLDSPPGWQVGSKPAFSVSPIWGPLEIALDVGRQRSNLAYERLSRDLCTRGDCGADGATSGLYGFHLDSEATAMPLGWTLSPKTLNAILDVTVRPEFCGKPDPAPGETRAYSTARARFGCHAKAVAELFALPPGEIVH